MLVARREEQQRLSSPTFGLDLCPPRCRLVRFAVCELPFAVSQLRVLQYVSRQLLLALTSASGRSETGRHLQREMLKGDGLDGKRVVLCKTVAGLGNRIQGIMSCLALAVATRRALLVQWDLEVSTTPPHANGLMPCALEDVIAFPAGIDLNASRAFAPAEEKHNKIVEAYVSQMVLNSGKSPSWGDLLLCSNLTYMLKHTPVLSIPAWRWMPEILSNPAYSATLQRLFRPLQPGDAPTSTAFEPPPFYRTVAPEFVRPAQAVLAAADALRAYWPPGSWAVGLQVRLGLETDNREESAHFFTPASMWRSWLRCAYTAVSHLHAAHDPPVRARASQEVWFIAADSVEAKVKMMMGMGRQEGAVTRALNVERVTTARQRATLLGLNPATSSTDSAVAQPGLVGVEKTGHEWVDDVLLPVVVDFASGTRVVFLGRSASRIGCPDVQAAMLEMHLLSWSRVLIASHLSTFSTLPGASMEPSAILHVNRDGDCLPALSLEPLSDAGSLFRNSAHCFSERHLSQHSWSRPRRRSVRERA